MSAVVSEEIVGREVERYLDALGRLSTARRAVSRAWPPSPTALAARQKRLRGSSFAVEPIAANRVGGTRVYRRYVRRPD